MEDNYLDRIRSIDYVKLIAIFIVVCLHTMSFGGNEIQSEFTRLLLYLFPRFVIPFFFIVSGFLFGGKIIKNMNPEVYFKTYVLKLAKFFIVSYVFYFIYDCVIRIMLAIYMGHNVKTEIVTYFSLLPKISVIYYGMGNTSYHLWFLTALIWSIVVLFLFIKFKKLHLLLIISFLFNLIGLFGQTYSGLLYLPLETRDSLFFGLFYTTVGCFFAFHIEWINGIIERVKSRTFIFLFLLSTIFQMVESSITVIWLDGTKGGVDYYLSTIPLTISLFMLIMKNRNIGLHSIFSQVGKNVMGIYVIHMFFISLFVLSLNFFGLEGLRKYFVFNLLLSLIVVVGSHFFFVFIQILKCKISFLLKKDSSNGRSDQIQFHNEL